MVVRLGVLGAKCASRRRRASCAYPQRGCEAGEAVKGECLAAGEGADLAPRASDGVGQVGRPGSV